MASTSSWENLRRELSRIAGRVDEYLASALVGEPKLLYDAAYHLIKAGGKRLRPFITVQFYRSVREDESPVIPAAAALELIHNFTLVHDDIMDRDDFRRGVPTVHKVYGEAMAILAGDALFAKAYQALLDSEALREEPSRMIAALESITRATIKLCEGQALDYQLSQSGGFSVDDYYKLIRLKTSTLFVASAEVGAIAAGAPQEVLSAARRYAENLGLAFQMVDDILGVVGDPSVTGKPVGSDIREGKKTLPIHLALERLGGEDRVLLEKAWGSGRIREEEMARLVEAIKKAGVDEEVRRAAARHVEEAVRSLSALPREEPRRLLEELARFVVERSY